MFVSLDEAVKLIIDGNLVAFPTETVYGLGANAMSNEACGKIYEAKARPSNNPIIVHIDSPEMAQRYALFNDRAHILADKFWPGPLTIVLPKKPDSGICDLVSAGLDTIGLRIPAYEDARSLIAKSGLPIAAPSANISNYISPTEANHVLDAFGERVPIIEGEKATYGLESTIIDLSGDQPKILRPGFITQENLSDILGEEVLEYSDSKVLAPGMMKKHYSPNSPIRINATELLEGEIGLGFGEFDLGELNLSKSGDLIEAAANLYSMLRLMDQRAKEIGAKSIAAARVPNEGIGVAVNDKLKRASSS